MQFKTKLDDSKPVLNRTQLNLNWIFSSRFDWIFDQTPSPVIRKQTQTQVFVPLDLSRLSHRLNQTTEARSHDQKPQVLNATTKSFEPEALSPQFHGQKLWTVSHESSVLEDLNPQLEALK